MGGIPQSLTSPQKNPSNFFVFRPKIFRCQLPSLAQMTYLHNAPATGFGGSILYKGISRKFHKGERSLTFRSSPFPSFSLPSLYPPLPFPLLPIEVGSLNQLGLYRRCGAESGAEPQPKSNSVDSKAAVWKPALVAIHFVYSEYHVNVLRVWRDKLAMASP